jgi:hypothetical protein
VGAPGVKGAIRLLPLLLLLSPLVWSSPAPPPTPPEDVALELDLPLLALPRLLPTLLFKTSAKDATPAPLELLPPPKLELH